MEKSCPRWDSNPRPFDHESQAYPLSHDRKGMHVNHLKIPAPALINNQFLLTGRERSGLLIFYEWPGLWLYSIVQAKNLLIGVVETECVTVDQYLIGIYHAPTIDQILFTLDCLNSVGITMDLNQWLFRESVLELSSSSVCIEILDLSLRFFTFLHGREESSVNQERIPCNFLNPFLVLCSCVTL